MNKDLWTFNELGAWEIDCDANDFYYTWVSLSAGNLDIKQLMSKFLKEGAIRVKARDGAIFIVNKGDKDDTENPEVEEGFMRVDVPIGSYIISSSNIKNPTQDDVAMAETILARDKFEKWKKEQKA